MEFGRTTVIDEILNSLAVVPMSVSEPAVKMDVLSQLELLHHIIEVTKILRLW